MLLFKSNNLNRRKKKKKEKGVMNPFLLDFIKARRSEFLGVKKSKPVGTCLGHRTQRLNDPIIPSMHQA